MVSYVPKSGVTEPPKIRRIKIISLISASGIIVRNKRWYEGLSPL